MLVSTREPTRESLIIVVKILSGPAPFFASRSFTLMLLQLVRLKFVDSLHTFVEERQPLLRRQLVPGPRLAADQLDSNALSRWNQCQLVPGPDAVLVGDGFGHGQLQLGSHLGHILT